MILCNARLREPIHYLPTCWINPLVCPGCVLHIAVSHGCSTLVSYMDVLTQSLNFAKGYPTFIFHQVVSINIIEENIKMV